MTEVPVDIDKPVFRDVVRYDIHFKVVKYAGAMIFGVMALQFGLWSVAVLETVDGLLDTRIVYSFLVGVILWWGLTVAYFYAMYLPWRYGLKWIWKKKFGTEKKTVMETKTPAEIVEEFKARMRKEQEEERQRRFGNGWE